LPREKKLLSRALFFDGTQRVAPLQAFAKPKVYLGDSRMWAVVLLEWRAVSPAKVRAHSQRRSDDGLSERRPLRVEIPFFADSFRFSSSAGSRERATEGDTDNCVARDFPQRESSLGVGAQRARRPGHHCSIETSMPCDGKSERHHLIRREELPVQHRDSPKRRPALVDTVKINMVSSRRFGDRTYPRLKVAASFTIFVGNSSALACPQHSFWE